MVLGDCMEENMDSSDLNLSGFCKKIEDDINRKLFSITNSLSFVTMCGVTLEEHLNQLLAVRELSEQLLDCLGFPTRDDIAAIAKKIIVFEDRLDRLDENLHLTLVDMEESRTQVARMTWEMAELSAEFGQVIEGELVKKNQIKGMREKWLTKKKMK